MIDNGLSYLKAVGIRIHTIRYQKTRKRIVQKDEIDHNGEDNDNVTSKDYKRIRGLFCIRLLFWSRQMIPELI